MPGLCFLSEASWNSSWPGRLRNNIIYFHVTLKHNLFEIPLTIMTAFVPSLLYRVTTSQTYNIYLRSVTFKLWSNAVPTFMASWLKCTRFFRYFRYIEWYTSRHVHTLCQMGEVFQKKLVFHNHNKCSVCAGLPGLSHSFRCSSCQSLVILHSWRNTCSLAMNVY